MAFEILIYPVENFWFLSFLECSTLFTLLRGFRQIPTFYLARCRNLKNRTSENSKIRFRCTDQAHFVSLATLARDSWH